MSDAPFSLRPRAAPPGFPPDAGANQVIYASHINAIRDSVALWPGDVNAQGHVLSNVTFGAGVTLPAHAHAAADVTSGVFAVARLGAGAASASVWLRGDGAWAALPAGVTQTPWTSDIDAAGFRLVNTGNVGIGNSAATLPQASISEINVIVGRTTSSLGRLTVCGNAATSPTTIGTLQFANYGVVTAEKRLAQIHVTTDGALDSGAMIFSTWSLGAVGERMRIVAGGNVGIATSTPQVRLAVTGPSNGVGGGGGIEGIAHFTTGSGGATDERIEFGIVDGGYGWIQALKPGTNTRPLVLNPLAGNVGIGTATPASRLSFGDASPNITQRIALFETASGGGFRGVGMANPSAGVWGVGVYASTVNAPTDANMALFVHDNGNVGIGTASPLGPLSVRVASDVTVLFQGGPDVAYITATNDAGGTSRQLILTASRFEFRAGQLYVINMASANPGAGSKALWYDPADGNRVKFAP